MILDNSKTILSAKQAANVWQSFNAYETADVMDENLVWSITQQADAQDLVQMINTAYQVRQQILPSLELRFCDGLPFAMEHLPLLVVETQNGIKALFLDEVWTRTSERNKTPYLYLANGARKLLFVASFDKTSLFDVQKVFEQALWSQIMMLSDFERRFLSGKHKNALLPKRQAQHQLFRYMMNLQNKEYEQIKSVFADQSFPESVIEKYADINQMPTHQVHDEIVKLFIGPTKTRGEAWKSVLVQDLKLAGESYGRALLKCIIEYLAWLHSKALPIIKDEPEPSEAYLATLAKYEEFARVVLPSPKRQTAVIEDVIKTPVVFQEIEPTEDHIQDAAAALPSVNKIAMMVERAIMGVKNPSPYIQNLQEKYSAGVIASRIIAHMLTIFHIKQAVYQLEDVESQTGLRGLLVYFEDGFVQLVCDILEYLKPTDGTKCSKLDTELAEMTLYKLCWHVSEQIKDPRFSASLAQFLENKMNKQLMQLILLQRPETYDGQKCPILNIKRAETNAAAIEKQIRQARYWAFINIPFDDAQLKTMQAFVMEYTRLPKTIMYTLPKSLYPLEEARCKALADLLTNKAKADPSGQDYQPFLIGNQKTQELMLDFDKTQRREQIKRTQPVLNNCVIAGDGQYVVQRLNFTPKKSEVVLNSLEQILNELLTNTHNMMISDMMAYRELVVHYRNMEKNPEAGFFQELPNEQWQSLYIYFKQLRDTSLGDTEAKASFAQACRFLEYLLKGYLLLPFYVLRNEAKPMSINHLLGIDEQGVLMGVYDNTPQIAMMVNKRLPPFSALGFKAIRVIDAVVSGEFKDGLHSVIHRQGIIDFFKMVAKQEEKALKDPRFVPDYGIYGNQVLQGEFLLRLDSMYYDDESLSGLPIRTLDNKDEAAKVVTVDDLKQILKPYFDLLPSVNDQVVVFPISKASKYDIQTVIQTKKTA